MDNRLIGGVAAGIARHLGTEAAIVRVAFVAATLIGGVGAVLYGLALLVMPRYGEAHATFRMPRQAGIGAAAVLVLIAVGGSALIGGLNLLGLGRIGVAAYLISLGLAALWWRENMAERAPSADAQRPVHDSPYPPGDPLETAPAKPRGRSWTLPTLSLAVVVVGVLMLLRSLGASELGPGGIAAAALGVVGLGLVLSAFLGRGGGLIPIGIVLTVAVACLATAGTTFSGGFGERNWAPTAAAAIPERYELGAGEARLDLRRVSLPSGTTEVEVDIGAGDFRVLLPAETNLTVDVRVGFGNIDARGFSRTDNYNDDGPGAEFVERVTVPGATSTLRLEVDLGFGNVDVTGAQ